MWNPDKGQLAAMLRFIAWLVAIGGIAGVGYLNRDFQDAGDPGLYQTVRLMVVAGPPIALAWGVLLYLAASLDN